MKKKGFFLSFRKEKIEKMVKKQRWDTIYREITPLTENDCFRVFERVKSVFDFPLHVHKEFELNFIKNGKAVKRIIGDHIQEIDDIEMVLVGSNLPHGWFTHQCTSKEIEEITIQFPHNLLDQHLLNRNRLNHIKELLSISSRGILFSRKTTEAVLPKLRKLNHLKGFESMLCFLSVLHDLSMAQDITLLSSPGFHHHTPTQRNQRIQDVFDFIKQNQSRDISLAEVASLTNLSKEGFSRFFRKHTGKTFIETLNEIRLGTASRALIETEEAITQIAYQCGFKNLSYFNRLFKRKYGITPKAFRRDYHGKRSYI